MAENISTKDLTGHDTGVTEVTNWISQINAGGQVYDIATHHGITFKDGKSDTTGTKWNGLTDIEIVIPNITDIVQNPIEFAGTVNKGGVNYNDTHKDGPKIGYLVFVTEDCEFEGHVCEAGDMAIYDGSEWKVVTGENQVSIVGNNGEAKTTFAIGSAKDVLTVEGKTLTLTLDYEEINNHVTTTPGKTEDVVLSDIIVDSTYIKLTQGDSSEETIGKVRDLTIPTELKDGTVTLENATGLVNSVDFGTFTQGTLPSFSKNSQKDLDVKGGSLNQVEGTDFVKSVSMDAVTFTTADETDDNKISMITSITSVAGQEFLNGIHTTDTSKNETADFTIAGYVTPETEGVKFVEGIVGNLDPVTSISDGKFELVDGSDLATGFGAAQDGNGGDVLSNVTVSANNDTSVLNSATVVSHVLTFGSTLVTSGVSVSYQSKSLQKTGFKYTKPVATTTSFKTSGFTKVSDVSYTFDKAKETTYTTSSAMWKLNTPALEVATGSYIIDHTNMKATVPAELFIATATEGTLPTWTGASVSKVNVTGSVSKELTTNTVQITESLEKVTLPGAYTLVNASGEGAIEVGAAGELAQVVTATVDLSGYITSVTISE